MLMVDSTLYIHWMRRRRNPTAILRPYVLLGQIATCGVIKLEVLRGIIKPAVKGEITELLNAEVDIPVAPAVWSRITDLAWSLDRKGSVLPVSDLIIAGCALHVGATVISTDSHFGRIPGLTIRTDLPELPEDMTTPA